MSTKPRKAPKPQTKSVDYYEWSKVKKYIDYKVGADINDFYGKYRSARDHTKPYTCFWHLLVDIYQERIDKELMVVDMEMWRDCAEDGSTYKWALPIIDLLQAEFGKEFMVNFSE